MDSILYKFCLPAQSLTGVKPSNITLTRSEYQAALSQLDDVLFDFMDYSFLRLKEHYPYLPERCLELARANFDYDDLFFKDEKHALLCVQLALLLERDQSLKPRDIYRQLNLQRSRFYAKYYRYIKIVAYELTSALLDQLKVIQEKLA